MPTNPTPITALPASPDRNDRATFSARATASFDALKNNFVPEANALAATTYNNAVEAAAAATTATTKAAEADISADAAAASALTALNAPGTSATSTSTLTIGTGSKSLTIQTGKSLVAGANVILAMTSDSTKRMSGVVTSYNSSTGDLVVSIDTIIGSGSASNWSVALGAATGQAASQAEMETGTEPAIRSMSPLRVAQAIAALGKSKILYSARSSNTPLGASDFGKFIDLSGNFAQTFDAAATLGDGWFCYLRANGPDEVFSANMLVASSANVIVNGGFDTDTDWTKGTGWTIAGGVANGAATTGALTSTAFTAPSNALYVVTYTLTVTSGTVRSRFGTSTAGTARSTSGTYTEYWIGSGGFSFVGVSAFTGTIDNVSVTRIGWTMPALEVGADYVLDYTISAGGTEAFEFSVGATEMGASRQSISYSKRFTAASASTSLSLLVYKDHATSTSNPTVYSALQVSGVSLKKIVSNGTITLDPSGSETVDGQATLQMYPREVRLIVCDGTKLVTSVISGYYKEFYASGTWVKPTGYASHTGMLWGGGSSGHRNGSELGGAGGGCCPFSLPSSLLDATETVVIGAGGAAVTTSAVGNIGGGTSFAGVAIVPSSDSIIGSTIHTAVTDASGGSAIGFERATPVNTTGRKALYAGGSSGSSTYYSTSSIYGGGAGSGSTVQSYTEDAVAVGKATKSTFAGNGGFAQTNTTCGVGEAGFIPAGGGGCAKDGADNRSGAGARGELRIWGIV